MNSGFSWAQGGVNGSAGLVGPDSAGFQLEESGLSVGKGCNGEQVHWGRGVEVQRGSGVLSPFSPRSWTSTRRATTRR